MLASSNSLEANLLLSAVSQSPASLHALTEVACGYAVVGTPPRRRSQLAATARLVDNPVEEMKMDHGSLRNVLGILRLIAAAQPNTSRLAFIVSLAGNDVSPPVMARAVAYLQDQFASARVVIDNSQLVEEAKAGIRSALSVLSEAFYMENLQYQIDPLLNQCPGYIGNFVILLSSAGVSTETDVPEEASDLAAEIDSFSAQFDNPAVDPVVRNIAKKHMVILSSLLRHIPIFGLEPALVAYFELLSTLRRADSKSSETSKGNLDPLMVTVKTWGERLGSIDAALTTGANLLERAKGAGHLLQYIPGLLG